MKTKYSFHQQKSIICKENNNISMNFFIFISKKIFLELVPLFDLIENLSVEFHTDCPKIFSFVEKFFKLLKKKEFLNVI